MWDKVELSNEKQKKNTQQNKKSGKREKTVTQIS